MYMFKKIVVLFLISIGPALAAAQTAVIKPDLKLVGGLDIRNSFINQNPVKIYGVSAGVVIDEKERFTVGVYALTPSSVNQIIAERSTNTVSITQASLYFAGIGYTRRIVNRGIFEIAIPLEAGIGFTNITRIERRGGQDITLSDDHGFLPLQAGLKLEIHLTRWVGAGGSIGYRTAIINEEYKTDYTGMYFTYGVSIYLSQIYKDILRYERLYGDD